MMINEYQELEDMRHVANIGQLLAQIDSTAFRFTAYLRMFGIQLSEGRGRVPLQAEVNMYLRKMVSNAYEGLLQAARDAPRGAADLQVEGYDSDDRLFDVLVHSVQAKPGFLELTVLLHG